jgi:hypothetical protein
MRASVLEYLGKWEGGILVLISIEYLDKFFEGIFYYTYDKMIINVDSGLKELLGSEIELWDGYPKFMEDIINLVEPYDEIYNDLEEIDPDNILS